MRISCGESSARIPAAGKVRRCISPWPRSGLRPALQPERDRAQSAKKTSSECHTRCSFAGRAAGAVGSMSRRPARA